MYKVKFECDLLGDHTASIPELCEIDTINFLNAFDAILFIEDCTSPLTKVEEIIPWLANNQQYFTEIEQKAKPFSSVSDEIANVYLVKNETDFKTLINH
tara:strand:- start:1143 stop:1439 length:297 start_codon:yes stop_codon:yes gene_type:complete